MTEPRRPEPFVSRSSRLRQRVELRREEFARRRQVRGLPQHPGDELGIDGSRDLSLVFTAMVAVGAAIFALGSLWVWQSWSHRSAPPIDDLMPVFAGPQGAEPAATPLAFSDSPPNSPPADSPLADSPPDSPRDWPTGSNEQSPQITAVPEPAGVPEIIVHLSGAVVRPGVVKLADGSRVYQALELAAGPLPDADLDRVNLAAPLFDGERIHVPALGEEAIPELVPTQRPALVPGLSSSTPTAPVDAGPAILDINQATARELEELPGVGPAIAEVIVRTRTDRGPFLSVDELLEVPGIGDAKLALMAPFVRVDAAPRE